MRRDRLRWASLSREKSFTLFFSFDTRCSPPSPLSLFYLTGAQVLLAQAEDLGGGGARVGRRGKGAGGHGREGR